MNNENNNKLNRTDMKRSLFAGIAIIMLSVNMNAQDAPKRWTLEECIRYAIANNVSLKQREQDKVSRTIELNASQASWLPNLNVNFGQNLDFGRSPASDNTIVDNNSANSSLNVNLSMPLFNGLKIVNDIAVRKLNLMAATESLNKAKEDLSLTIASYYLQALYNKELLIIAELQVSLTKEQVTRTKVLVDAGQAPASQLSLIHAQLARDEVTLTEAENNVSLALLDLAQALELERLGADFDIVQPESKDIILDNMRSLLPPDNIYDNAVTFKPQIKEQEYLLASRKKSLRVAQADYYPRLSFSANYGNGYYRYFGDGDYESASFSDQLKRNERKTIGLSLNIPIFNRLGVRNNVRQARVGIVNQELTMENSKKTLYKEIQQAYFMAVAAQEKYVASEKSVVASKEALTYTEERYAVGRSTVYEYNESKTKYAQSLSEQAQAKYNFIFRAKILDFYNGTAIALN
jgi:outer membrane protein